MDFRVIFDVQIKTIALAIAKKNGSFSNKKSPPKPKISKLFIRKRNIYAISLPCVHQTKSRNFFCRNLSNQMQTRGNHSSNSFQGQNRGAHSLTSFQGQNGGNYGSTSFQGQNRGTHSSTSFQGQTRGNHNSTSFQGQRRAGIYIMQILW